MGKIIEYPPERPESCEFASIAQLYEQFESIFLQNGGKILSAGGHEVCFFDHHFFHMAAVYASDSSRLFMHHEKEEIRSTVEGFGKYRLDHSGSRARNLLSAHATILCPDEIWGDCPVTTTGKWVYVKEFASRPYPFTIALLVDRPAEGNIIVPVSSFPCKSSDIKKWRRGTKLYP